MNLLTDPWIPVVSGGAPVRLGLGDVLCSADVHRLQAPRDDFDAGTVGLAAAIVATLFPDLTDEQLVEYERTPLARRAWGDRVKACAGWFDLFDLKHPFMQTRGVEGVDKPVGMVLAGSPGASSHLWWDRRLNAARRMCGPCAATALFVRATMTPSFGGGYCNSLRGGAPVDFHIVGRGLRETIWRNTPGSTLREATAPANSRLNDFPVWVSPIPEATPVEAATIGITRGLLWQPARIEFVRDSALGECDVCGEGDRVCVSTFRAVKFKVIVKGQWPHPNGSASTWMDRVTGERRHAFASFTDAGPAWTATARWPEPPGEGQRGWTVPPIVGQCVRLWPNEAVEVAAIGYEADQAKIVRRRSERILMECGAGVPAIARLAVEARTALSTAVYHLVVNATGRKPAARRCALAAEADFDATVNELVAGATLATGGPKAATSEPRLLARAALAAYEAAAETLGHEARFVRHIAVGRVSLLAALKRARAPHDEQKEEPTP